MNISYRKADINDIEQLVQLRIDFLKEVQPQESRLYTEEALRTSLSHYFHTNIMANQFIAWVAVDGNKLIATSGLVFFEVAPGFTLIDGKIAYIMNMFTDANYRGKGIAKELFQYILEEAKEIGYRRISLHATDAGRIIYEKFGFKLTNDEMVLNIP